MGSKDFEITNIERLRLDVPFHPRCAETMTIRGPGWSVVDLYKVTLGSGVVGIGETIVGYTWGSSTDEQTARLVGENAFDLLWDDSLGAGV